MGNKMKNNRMSARRAATFLAAVAVLVISSGVALMVSATPANAAPGHIPVNVCHATSSDSNPYVFIVVDADSTKLQGHLAHRNSPNKTWKDAGSFGGVEHAAGDAKPDIIGDYVDGQGVTHTLDGVVTSARCNANVETPDDVLTTANVTFTEPTCANNNTASYATSGEHVDFAVTAGSAAPGAAITVTATAQDGFVFAGDTDELDFSHTFAAAQLNCSSVNSNTVVSPPKENNPPAKHHVTTSTPSAVTPTVVHAGLASTTVQDTRSEQGLALLVAGMVMLVGAGGLRLRAGRASKL